MVGNIGRSFQHHGIDIVHTGRLRADSRSFRHVFFHRSAIISVADHRSFRGTLPPRMARSPRTRRRLHRHGRRRWMRRRSKHPGQAGALHCGMVPAWRRRPPPALSILCRVGTDSSIRTKPVPATQPNRLDGGTLSVVDAPRILTIPPNRMAAGGARVTVLPTPMHDRQNWRVSATARPGETDQCSSAPTLDRR